MLEKQLERKIRKSTKSKEYEKSLDIIKICYKKQFKKMAKYMKVKDKNIYLYDYIKSLKIVYEGTTYYSDIEDVERVIYKDKLTTKQQITWLLENCSVFNEYKLM